MYIVVVATGLTNGGDFLQDFTLGFVENAVYSVLTTLLIAFAAVVINNTRKFSGNIFAAFRQTISSIFNREIQESIDQADLFAKILKGAIYIIAISPLLLITYSLIGGLFLAIAAAVLMDPTVGNPDLLNETELPVNIVAVPIFILSAIPAYFLTRWLEMKFTWVKWLITSLLFLVVLGSAVTGGIFLTAPLYTVQGWVVPTLGGLIVTAITVFSLYFIFALVPERWRTGKFGYGSQSTGSFLLRVLWNVVKTLFYLSLLYLGVGLLAGA